MLRRVWGLLGNSFVMLGFFDGVERGGNARVEIVDVDIGFRKT